MIWKTLVLAFLLTGVLADDNQKDQIKQLLRSQCKKAGAEDKYDDVSNAGQAFVDCVKELANVEQLKKEIDDAKPKGALDEVFKKYCEKTPQLKTCIHTLMDAVSPCLDAALRDHLTPMKNGTDQLIDFVCYKDGDRIALFIAEGGPECFQDKTYAIRECANQIKDQIQDQIKDTVTGAKETKSLTLAEQCAKFDSVSKCVVDALEKCTTPTPGNMAESLFRYVRKGSPCYTALPKN